MSRDTVKIERSRNGPVSCGQAWGADQAYGMGALRHRWPMVLLIIAALLTLLLLLQPRPSPRRGISISFVGFTNLPNTQTRFALFSILNEDSAPIRWRGNWVEVEGDGNHKAPTVNLSLPWITAVPLKSGESQRIAVGEPLDQGRWRVCLLSSRYSLRERFREFVLRHGILLGLGAPENLQTNSTQWLSNLRSP